MCLGRTQQPEEAPAERRAIPELGTRESGSGSGDAGLGWKVTFQPW